MSMQNGINSSLMSKQILDMKGDIKSKDREKFVTEVSKVVNGAENDKQLSSGINSAYAKYGGTNDSKLDALKNTIDGNYIPNDLKTVFESAMNEARKEEVSKSYNSSSASASVTVNEPYSRKESFQSKELEITRATSSDKKEYQEILNNFIQNRTNPETKMIDIDPDEKTSKSTTKKSSNNGTSYRIDFQNRITDKNSKYTGYSNFQVQTGTKTIAKVLIAPGSYSKDDIKGAFDLSMDASKSSTGQQDKGLITQYNVILDRTKKEK